MKSLKYFVGILAVGMCIGLIPKGARGAALAEVVEIAEPDAVFTSGWKEGDTVVGTCQTARAVFTLRILDAYFDLDIRPYVGGTPGSTLVGYGKRGEPKIIEKDFPDLKTAKAELMPIIRKDFETRGFDQLTAEAASKRIYSLDADKHGLTLIARYKDIPATQYVYERQRERTIGGDFVRTRLTRDVTVVGELKVAASEARRKVPFSNDRMLQAFHGKELKERGIDPGDAMDIAANMAASCGDAIDHMRRHGHFNLWHEMEAEGGF